LADLIASTDATQVWDATSGKLLFAYPSYPGQGADYPLAWSPDGKYIVSTGTDYSVSIWDASSKTVGILSNIRYFFVHPGSLS
jgi:WD40 repeat protein